MKRWQLPFDKGPTRVVNPGSVFARVHVQKPPREHRRLTMEDYADATNAFFLQYGAPAVSRYYDYYWEGDFRAPLNTSHISIPQRDTEVS